MLEFIHREHSAARAFIVAGAVWFVIGTTFGAFSAIHFLAPEFFSNIPQLVFGRVRPSHVNSVIYAFIVQTLIGMGLFFVPSLLRTRLWSEPLAWLTWLLYNIAVTYGPIGFLMGHGHGGREYAEYPWTADMLITISILLLAINTGMTILRRQEQSLYVSIWYFMGFSIWTATSYPIGNVVWHPSTGAMAGIVDEVLLWTYAHDLVGLILTPLAIGAAYYVIPRVARNPVYSHTLEHIGFWTLIIFYTHIGAHHILQAPIPNWLRVMATVDSGMMILPVAVVLVNLWMTVRGSAGLVWKDPAGMMVMTGLVWYFFTCIQGPLMSLPHLQRVTHFTQWTPAHAHMAVLGFSATIALGGMWHVLPMVLGRRLWSRRLVFLQFSLVTIGVTGFFLVLTMAGLIQGHAWFNGETVYRVLPTITVYMALRLAFGLFVITGAVVGLCNLWMTIRHGEPLSRDEVEYVRREGGTPA